MESKERNYFFDNFKFFMILSIVVYYLISPYRKPINTEIIGLTNNLFCNVVCSLISLSVLPCFFIICGIFSKPGISLKQTYKTIALLLIPYLFFEILSSLVSKKDTTDLFIESFYHLWFIALLFFYRLITPYLYYLRLGTVYLFITSMTIAAHFEIPGSYWAAWDVMKFAPYYLTGFWLSKNKDLLQNLLRSKNIKLISMFSLLLSGLIFWFLGSPLVETLPDNQDAGNLTGVFYLIKNYDTYDSIMKDFLYRILGVTFSLGFIFLIPKAKSVTSTLGKNSLYAYLLHPLFIPVLENMDFYSNSGPLYIALLVVMSIFITVFLSLPFVANLLTHFFNTLTKAVVNKYQP